MTSEVFNTDCLEYMRSLPDKTFQLAIADPPYGVSYARGKNGYGVTVDKLPTHRDVDWDAKIPDKAFFDELLRVSDKVIIWGGNYFTHLLPVSKCWIVWDKCDGMENKSVFADAELAWTNMTKVVSLYRLRQLGFISATQDSDRIHPTQKPTELYGKLTDFLTTDKFGTLPENTQTLLRRQHQAMHDYREALRQRIRIDAEAANLKVEINDPDGE